MNAVPCEPQHLLEVGRIGDTPDTRANVLGQPGSEELLRRYARAFVQGGQVLAVVGVMPLWDSRGYAFAMLSNDALKHGLSLTRETKRALAYAETELGFRRIEAAVEVGYRDGLRWIRTLGFQYEGTMTNFGPGGIGDYYLYARCR